MDRGLHYLGMAKKAGLLAIGSEDAGVAARAGKASLIVSANDASEGSMRRALENALLGGVPYVIVPYTKNQFGSITGRGAPGTIGFLEAGLAAGFIGELAEEEPEAYGKTLELLADKKELQHARQQKRKPAAKRRTAK